MILFEFARLCTVTKVEDAMVISVIDPNLVNSDSKACYSDRLVIPAHRALPRLRLLIRRLQMRKIWHMAKNGRFKNITPK